MIMTKQEFLISADLQEQTLEFWLEQRWLIPDETATEARFTDCDIARASLIHDLQRDFGVNDAGVALILHLVDQLHGVREALSLLEETTSLKSRG
ncbi:chaperone modulator CbpM [Castellaniella sp.]|uniref:chaperone modulator CbpM n=1 Tax=Castellaniella sp. TaxID=1955812 RepID=UPI0025B9ADD2|nr:chaperone modulator CbpM [Castellaniella sp.]